MLGINEKQKAGYHGWSKKNGVQVAGKEAGDRGWGLMVCHVKERKHWRTKVRGCHHFSSFFLYHFPPFSRATHYCDM
jgi:hypothetical protein